MILVTGGAGYIGSFTVRELITNGYEVVVADSLENGHKTALDKRAILEIADVGDKDRMREIFEKYPIEAVIDFAAYLAVGESMENPQKYMKNNVENFVRLLDVMKEKGCKYIIKSSTASTYGEPEDKYFPLQEDYQEQIKPSCSGLLPGWWEGKQVQGEEFFKLFLNHYEEIFAGRDELRLTEGEMAKLRIPTSIYGLTKLMDEIILNKNYESRIMNQERVRPDGLDSSQTQDDTLVCHSGREGLPDPESSINYVALRYFNVCGAALDGQTGDDKPVPTNLMTLVILNVLGKTKKLKVFGNDYPTKDGTGLRDYIHPIDLATGHVKALKYLLSGGQSATFNLGTGDGYTVFEVIDEIEKASGKKVDYEIVARRSGDPAVSYANPSKANRLLGWKAQYSLKDMAETAWKWHGTHPEGYNDSRK